jgi:hypothetical protein
MRTAIIIIGGLVLLGAFVLVGAYTGGLANPAMARAALWFLPVWLAVAAINMWIGVTSAGYSVAEEAPIFAIIFAIPAAVALFLWWRLKSG